MKKLLSTVVCLIAVNTLWAQSPFMHSLGISYLVAGNTSAPAATYSPRLNVVEVGGDATLSIGTHASVGFEYNTTGGARSFAVDIPLMAEFNFGHAAKWEGSSKSFGGFLGAGYGYSRIGNSAAFGGYYNEAAGLVFGGGVKFDIVGYSAGVRGAYMLNSRAVGNNVLAIGIMFNFIGRGKHRR